ncbi:hypothetical protein [Nonomuraea jiangxiensis]|uniref:hypothetical protein n=1 Tax=Nonomuraea jiangxiensis TaxID=633440 RepID=UPI000B807A38|nr:hypothetical protein [Nonomuraea jiangxiensis]
MANYRCTGGIAGAGVELEARMTPQVEGGLMNVGWAMSYKGQRRFGSPGYFSEGSLLSLDGVVDISGAWNGQLRPQGDQEQGELVPGDFLELPEGLSDQGSIDRSGTIRFKPGALAVRFTPAEGEAMVNDKPGVDFTAGWAWEHTEEQYGDHVNDVTKTSTAGEIAKLRFTGTKVEYIGRRAPDLGPIRVILDGQPVTDPPVEPGKNRAGQPMIGTETQEVLWTSPELEYGPHTIEIVNIEDKPAYVDAFRVTTSGITAPPTHDQATCQLVNDPGVIEITVSGPTDDPTEDPTDEPTEEPTDEDPGNDDPPNDDPNDDDPQDDSQNGGPDHVSVLVMGSTSATPRTTGPTATKYARAQVARTPQGGVDTGEAPDPVGPPFGLVAGGAVLLMGSVGGGLMLRRRAGEHVGGRK